MQKSPFCIILQGGDFLWQNTDMSAFQAWTKQNERENIKKRQAQGIAAAKAKGVQFGRPEVPMPKNFKEIVKLWEKQLISTDAALKKCGMSKTTFYRRRRELKLIRK